MNDGHGANGGQLVKLCGLLGRSAGKKYPAMFYSLVLIGIGVLIYLSLCSSGLPEFVYSDEKGLHWDYQGISEAYANYEHSKRRDKLLKIIVQSRAVQLVPQIIESIKPGGYRDTEVQIRTITRLTGHDFSQDFYTKRLYRKHEIEQAKDKLQRWWEDNKSQVFETRGPVDNLTPPDHWPSLSLQLKADKDCYVQAEPIRLTLFLRNSGNLDYTFKYTAKKRAFALGYYQVLKNGEMIKIAEYDSDLGFGFGLLERTRYLIIEPESFIVVQNWLTDKYVGTYFAPGILRLRVRLIPLSGKHKNLELISNDLDIRVIRPGGNDLRAYEFITSKGLVDIGDKVKYGSGMMYGVLVPSNSSHPVGRYFLDNFGDTLYAPYVKYSMNWQNNGDAVRKRLELIYSAPRDFPLLPETYVSVLNNFHSLEKDEQEKLLQHLKSTPARQVIFLDPRLKEKFDRLIRIVEEK